MELAFKFDFLSLWVAFLISLFQNFITFAFIILEIIAGILSGNFSLFWLFWLVCQKFSIPTVLGFNGVVLLLALETIKVTILYQAFLLML